jgi:hypothetical protein
MRASGSVLCSVIAAAYAAVHLAFLAPSLEDIDSINFALGLREFDVARHQPHPPGYPVYIALGRASLAAVHAAAPGLDQVRAEAVAFAFGSALAGAVALLATWALFRALDSTGAARESTDRAALWGSVLLAVAPLFWISGSRPMSDLPGLAMALGAQALLVTAWRRREYLVPGAFIAGRAIGLRVQAVWLTVPLLVVVALGHRREGVESGRSPVSWLLTRPLPAFGIGVLAWFVPLLIAAGGLDQYLRALGSQAGEDFAWVDMLWANPTPRRLAFALYETIVVPWGSVPLAVVVLVAAAAGTVIAATRARGALALLGVAFGPYALFHLLFQETPHVRYALPLLPPVAWLAACGVTAHRRAAPIAAAALCLFAGATALPGMLAYASEPHPAFRAIADMSASPPEERPAAVFAHFSVRRPLQAQAPSGIRIVEPPRTNEWLGPVDYWRGGGTAPVWFLADPRRTDLKVVDPYSRLDVRHYRWQAAERLELSGTRPLGVDWYRFERPGWFTGEGWSLTPELGGMTRLAGNGVDRRPIEAHVLRRPDPMVAIVGARHLGSAADGAVVLALTIDTRPVDEWTLDPAVSLNALRVLELPAGVLTGADAYARLAISARAASGGRTPSVAIRQFDIQPASQLVSAFDEGWHEEEYDNATGVSWRWSSGRSLIRVLPATGVRLRLRGESPLKYFDRPPTVRVTAAGRVIAQLQPDADFDWTIAVPEDDVRAAGGRIAVETEPVYLPGRAEGTADERQLGLRLFDISVVASTSGRGVIDTRSSER